jgi:hypothetical protein
LQADRVEQTLKHGDVSGKEAHFEGVIKIIILLGKF